MADRPIRASDDDRERVVDVLREQTAQGRLTMDEFEERMGAAYAATTWEDLRPLTRDLPVEVAVDDNGNRRVGHAQRTRQGPAERAESGGVDRRWALIAPALALASVFVLIAVTTGSPRSVAPLLFIGLFWACCGRGCRTRSARSDHRAQTRHM